MFKIEFTRSYSNDGYKTMEEVYEDISKNTGIDIETLKEAQRYKDPKPDYFSIYFMCNMMELGEQFVWYVANSDYNRKFHIKLDKVKTLKSMVVENTDVKLSPRDTINIHLPSNELFKVRQTLLLEDSCTNALQEELDKGWRIIAVIPRAGQRRPDYILGV